MSGYSSRPEFKEGDVSYDIKSLHSQRQGPGEQDWRVGIIVVRFPGLTPLPADVPWADRIRKAL